MFKSTIYWLNFALNNKLKTAIYISLGLIIFQTFNNLSRDASVRLPTVTSTSELCLVTHNVQAIREQHNTIHINPAKQIVEELLEIITYRPGGCGKPKSGEFLVVIIINTARHHFRERRRIRRTWGSVKKHKGWNVETFFLMGQAEYCLNSKLPDRKTLHQILSEENNLLEESRKYGDILIGAFTDTYRNLTYKHLMGYKFVQENCPQAEFIIKTDDDVFVNIPEILDMRIKELSELNVKKPFDIYCHQYNDTPTRDPNGKWFSTREEWPEDTYPIYCLGGDYAISMDWLKKIYSVRHDGGFFWVDDVFIMGKLRTIAEKTYNVKAKRLNLWQRGKMIDTRIYPGYVKDNCENTHVYFGWFVLLNREHPDFSKYVTCLWKRVLNKVNASVTIISNTDT